MGAFIKVCIVLIFAHAWRCLSPQAGACLYVDHPKDLGCFAIKGGTCCFTDMTVDSLRRPCVSVHIETSGINTSVALFAFRRRAGAYCDDGQTVWQRVDPNITSQSLSSSECKHGLIQSCGCLQGGKISCKRGVRGLMG